MAIGDKADYTNSSASWTLIPQTGDPDGIRELVGADYTTLATTGVDVPVMRSNGGFVFTAYTMILVTVTATATFPEAPAEFQRAFGMTMISTPPTVESSVAYALGDGASTELTVDNSYMVAAQIDDYLGPLQLANTFDYAGVDVDIIAAQTATVTAVRFALTLLA